MIDLIWSIYVVLKNSIIVFANCEKKMQNHFCDDRPGSRLSRQLRTTNHIT